MDLPSYFHRYTPRLNLHPVAEGVCRALRARSLAPGDPTSELQESLRDRIYEVTANAYPAAADGVCRALRARSLAPGDPTSELEKSL